MHILELTRSLRAKRISKGKWRAVCPIHGGRHSGPLSITDMGMGNIRLHCFGGCDQKDVLDALGLKWADLRPDTRIDPEVIRQIQVVEARREAERQERTRLLQLAKERTDYWHRQVEILGKALYVSPQPDKVRKDFNYAVDMERRCQKIWETL